MFVTFGTICTIFLAFYFIDVLMKASRDFDIQLRERNLLIQEARAVKDYFTDLNWNEMPPHQQACHQCAVERLRKLGPINKKRLCNSQLPDWPESYERYAGMSRYQPDY